MVYCDSGSQVPFKANGFPRLFSGFHVCLFIGATHLIRRSQVEAKQKVQQALLMLTLFTLGTICLVCYSSEFETMFIKQRDFPGGPSEWLKIHFAIPANILGRVVLSTCDILTDSILVCHTLQCVSYDTVVLSERISSSCTVYG